jgi:hypothetical protein
MKGWETKAITSVVMSVQPDHMHFPRAPEVSAVVLLGLLTAGRWPLTADRVAPRVLLSAFLRRSWPLTTPLTTVNHLNTPSPG